jgi:hypothetical protein
MIRNVGVAAGAGAPREAAGAPDDAQRAAGEGDSNLSTIGSARKAEKSGFFSSLFAGVIGIFHSIYSFICKLVCCRFYSSEAKVESLSAERREEIKETFVALRDEFLTRRSAIVGAGDFAAWWVEEFDKLSEEEQRLIILKDLEATSQEKCPTELVGTPQGKQWIEEYARKLYEFDSDGKRREGALEFVRQLKVAKVDGVKYYPSHVQHLPSYLQAIIDSMGE